MFNRMRIYTVHLQPDLNLSSQKPIFLKEGINMAAFVLPVFWALYKRLWFVAVSLIAFEVLIMFIGRAGFLSPAGVFVLDLAMHFWMGYAANDQLRSGLTKKGYLFSDVAVAENQLRAEQRYFDRCFSPTAA